MGEPHPQKGTGECRGQAAGRSQPCPGAGSPQSPRCRPHEPVAPFPPSPQPVRVGGRRWKEPRPERSAPCPAPFEATEPRLSPRTRGPGSPAQRDARLGTGGSGGARPVPGAPGRARSRHRAGRRLGAPAAHVAAPQPHRGRPLRAHGHWEPDAVRERAASPAAGTRLKQQGPAPGCWNPPGAQASRVLLSWCGHTQMRTEQKCAEPWGPSATATCSGGHSGPLGGGDQSALLGHGGQPPAVPTLGPSQLPSGHRAPCAPPPCSPDGPVAPAQVGAAKRHPVAYAS